MCLTLQNFVWEEYVLSQRVTRIKFGLSVGNIQFNTQHED